jgi:hypothetical protein
LDAPVTIATLSVSLFIHSVLSLFEPKRVVPPRTTGSPDSQRASVRDGQFGGGFCKWCAEVGFKRFEVIHLAGASSAALCIQVVGASALDGTIHDSLVQDVGFERELIMA